MSTVIGLVGYAVVVLSLIVLAVLLAIRFVRAHERGAAALEAIARTLESQGPRAPR